MSRNHFACRFQNSGPAVGPSGDALGHTDSGQLILVEAKANIPELLSPPSQATAKTARLIKKSLALTQRSLKARPGCDWSQRFYQYANRLAHLHYLWRLNRCDAFLVFVYFINASDVASPETEAEWRAAIEVLHEGLGIRGRIPTGRVTDIFIDVKALQGGN